MRIDLVLELNLKGDSRYLFGIQGDSSKVLGQTDMEHDAEESPIERGDGKKRPRRILGITMPQM